MRSHTRNALVAMLAGAALTTLSTTSSAAPEGSRVVAKGPHGTLVAGSPKLSREGLLLRGEAKARAAVSSVVTAPVELVKTSHDRFGDGDEIVTFGQTFRGLPVIGAGATVRMNAVGDVLFTSTDVATIDLPASTKPRIARAEAADRVARAFRIAVSADDAYLVVAQTLEGAKLAYAVLPRVPVATGEALRFLVDANDGTVFEARDMRTFAKAMVHPSNPEKSKNLELLSFGMDPVGEKLENPFLVTLNCVDKKQAKNVSFSGFNLKVHTCDLVQLAKPNTEGNYVYTPKDQPDPGASEDEYSEVSMYYHATRAYDYFRKLQGVADAQVVLDKPLRTIANLRVDAAVISGNIAAAGDVEKPLAPFQNAFFSPRGGGLGAIFAQIYGFSDGSMWFGQGPNRDYSYDGDVVVHEFGHAVVDNSLKLEAWSMDANGATAAPGSMNEGLADYFAAAVTGDPDVGEYASKDFAANLTVIRTLANKDTCENAIVGEVHFDSTLFSGALWDARTKLPEADRVKLDAAVYKSMRTNAGRGKVSYTELANLFLATVGADFPAAKPLLEEAFTARKVLPGCSRIRTFDGKAIEAPTGPSSPGAFAAPGKQTLGVRTTAAGLVTTKAAVPAGSTKATFSFKVLDRGGGGGGGVLGGGGTAFAPVLFVKFGAPLTWTTKGTITSDADLTLPLEAKATSAEIEIPADTKEIYVQIGNAGDQDGYYTAMSFAFDGPAPVPAPPGGNPAPAAPAAESESGCSVPSGSPTQGAPVMGLGLAALGLALASRRRKG